MSKNRDQLAVVLFQIRDDETERRIESESVARAAKLRPAQLRPFDALAGPADAQLLDEADAVVIGGSALSVFEETSNLRFLMETIRTAYEKKMPILGICFGAQLLASALGGRVERDNAHEEFGTFDMTAADDALTDPLFADAPTSFPTQCAHQDKIVKLPHGSVVLASSARCPVQAFTVPGTNMYGMQFHPERSRADYEKLLVMRRRNGTFDTARLDSAALRESPDAEQLVAKFVDRIVMPLV